MRLTHTYRHKTDVLVSDQERRYKPRVRRECIAYEAENYDALETRIGEQRVL